MHYKDILFIEASNVAIKTCITSLVAKRSCQLSYTMLFLLRNLSKSIINTSAQKLRLTFKTLNHTKKHMPPKSVFRCYLKVFAKMVTEIIILYRKVLKRDLLATFCFIKIDFIMKQCGKKQLHLHLTENLSDRCGQ